MNPEELLEALDPEQREVAQHLHGPLAVLAGAGTGKTRAITYRIAYGVKTGAYQPTNVLAVTFTNKAAGEMRSRLLDLGAGNVQTRTFHSAALSQLRYFWPQVIGGVVPEIREHKAPLVAMAAERLGFPTDRVSVRDFASELEWSKVSLIAPEDYALRALEARREIPGDLTGQDMAALISAYEVVKAERGVIDFEDTILILIGLMSSREDVAAQIRRQYKHFVVDEYQDVSPMQHRLLQLWLGDRRDICVVGDVSQTIYSFTGAKADYLASFSKEFPKARTVTLNRDYRSTAQIVDLANEVIGENHTEGAVFLRAMGGTGRLVEYREYADDEAEANEIAGRIISLHQQGVDYSDMAILYRTNSQSERFEAALSAAGVPATVRGTTRFFQRREVLEAMVVLRSIARGEASGGHSGMELPELVKGALNQMGWRKEPPAAHGAARERWDSLESLRLLGEDMWEKRQATIAQFVEELEERKAASNEPTQEAVTLSSLHASKGLEWKVVFLAGMSEGLMPISHAQGDEGVAEERRLLYVGITRAKEELMISYALGNGNRANRKVSRFLVPFWPKPESKSSASRKRVAKAKADFANAAPEDRALFEELREWRATAATEAQRPPYVIFHDTTLRDIAIIKPRTLTELGAVKGIGSTKLMRYGEEVLAVIAAFMKW
ncbi:ATP-dependent DNA helicase UvrD2 [Arcanobacterium wilhelmae]|uniref:ATP-dependent helicase n=1 Tax=Arcanobacterium wilhelmae TaxID=1803177 RepID=UPI0024152DED|nr:ATP-dependent DNA helicase UvrD2 [Arcanobacterium wilhelmae]WFN89893.1 ATP-dependent DNA helicase UvrD2 [Arcanobacterium wilhelmae]